MIDIVEELKQNGCIKTIAYFSQFNYPLSAFEVHQFGFQPLTEHQVKEQLKRLVNLKIVFNHEGYFGVEESEIELKSRKEAEKGAKLIWPKAIENGGLIYSLPFVKGVLVSGGLSKEVFREGDDIDYFIITQHNRVWITKLMLKLYKKVFLNNSKDYFCTNYIIGEHNLQIEEQNLFTSIELATLQPLGSEEYYKEFKKANEWIKYYLPNAQWKHNIDKEFKKTKSSKIIESLLSGVFGDWLDKRLMKVIFNKIKSNYRDKMEHIDFDLMFKSKRNISKIHPTNNQSIIMDRYIEKLENLGIKQ